MTTKKWPAISLNLMILLFFASLLILPLGRLLILAFTSEGQFTLANIQATLSRPDIGLAFGHSLFLASLSAFFAVILAFILAFTVNFTKMSALLKKAIETLALFPMFLPTLAYGYSIIYAFGAQSPLTRLNHDNLILTPFGPQGMVIGFIIYTFPIAFILLNSSMKYIDMRLFTVSRLMGDSRLRSFWTCLIRPLLISICLAFIQAFFLSFTDFGLPSALAGNYPLLSSLLFSQMQGALANFGQGTVIALLMLLPSLLTTALMVFLQRFQVKQQAKSSFVAFAGRAWDWVFGGASLLIISLSILVFLPIFVVPFVTAYPYVMDFSLVHLQEVFNNQSLISIYQLTLKMAMLTALIGSVFYFAMAYLATRSRIAGRVFAVFHFLSNMTNAIPGMVLGIAFLFIFSGTPLNGSLWLLVLVNLIHFLASPYQMAIQALSKLSKHYETTSRLLGDSFIKTIFKVILPNIRHTIFEMMSYLFIQSMVTISAIVFLVGVDSQTITTSMQSLQQFNQYAQVFVLALFLFGTNLLVKLIFHFLGSYDFSALRARTSHYKKRILSKKEAISLESNQLSTVEHTTNGE
ncbi:ABC transporter permease subunit [Lactococcus termiticola]|uniref:Iron ABC transporter permease protein n=1 Tax=Lactococcus termiticola TaxID=2169526 RepID=A0A2R5HDW1_9LACT|nr:ABC transporter permease subunit [Lactococcus termiticola]GBG96257.1 iron ABC transporter permease protein [Lactococcus termiticola]